MENMELHTENELTDIVVDYERMNHYFDRKYMKKYTTLAAIGWAISGIGALAVILVMYAHMWILHSVAWPVLIAGVVLLLVVLNKIVKDNEITELIDMRTKQFVDKCNEKLGYPNDIDDQSLHFTGCTITPDTVDNLHKLKSGNYISNEASITHIYVDLMKKKVDIGYMNFSIVEDRSETKFFEFYFDEFDASDIVTEQVNGINASRFVLSMRDKELFSSPISDNDYIKEQFINGIVHQKEVRR